VLFLIEGLPACILGFAVLKFLPDGPADAPWLSAAEKEALAVRLAADDATPRRNLWPALRDPRVIALGLVLLGQNAGAYGVQLWLPQIVQAMGFSNRATGFIVALPFVALMVAMIAIGRSSDVKGERIWHVALPLLIAASGLALASLSPPNLFVLAALSLAVIFIDGGLGAFWSLPSLFLSGTAAAGGIALIRTIGAFGGFLGPTIVGLLREETGGYPAAMLALAFVLMLSAFALLAMSRALAPRTT
jgi:ACS family tartrate transporter-like MFS transporter